LHDIEKRRSYEVTRIGVRKQLGARLPWLVAGAAGALVVVVVLLAGGCGGSSNKAHQASSTPAAPSAPAASPTSPAESSPPTVSFDFNSTADCLDQFSGSGATRGTAHGAETASVAVPKDGNWDTFTSVEMYFFPTAAKAANFAKHGGLELTETMVAGNVVITGGATVIPYSHQLVLGCLKP
jgi:hypothetical protein